MMHRCQRLRKKDPKMYVWGLVSFRGSGSGVKPPLAEESDWKITPKIIFTALWKRKRWLWFLTDWKVPCMMMEISKLHLQLLSFLLKCTNISFIVFEKITVMSKYDSMSKGAKSDTYHTNLFITYYYVLGPIYWLTGRKTPTYLLTWSNFCLWP